MRNYEILPETVILENENKILSRRELEILILVCAGFENNQIAEIYRVTLSTVKKQLEKIYEKLHAQNRANAVFIACFNHLISLKDYTTIIGNDEIVKFIGIYKKFSRCLYY